MKLKRLHSDVIAKTRSSFTLNTVCQCIMELILNSLDAKATAVAVRINLVTLRIQVVDNGEGILRENMEMIGLRYFTNKCYNLEELEKRVEHYGFRGEALTNLTELSKIVNITSKHISSSETYSSILGKDSKISIAKNRPSVGTTVTVEGLFNNFPVRQKRIVKELEIDEIKKNIRSLIIIHPGVTFTLRDDVKSELLLSSQKLNDIPSAFYSLHPEIKHGTVMKISKSKVSIKALLFKSYTENNKLQYIYVNKRPIYSCKIQKIIRKLFHKNMKCQKDSKNIHPIYVLNIKCPYSDVDILLNPSKTMAEFKNWDRITQCIEKLIDGFFGKNSSKEKIKLKEPDTKQPKLNSNCGVSQIRGVVRAFGFKRKNDDLTNKSPEKLKKLCTSLSKNKKFNETYDIVESTCKEDQKKFKCPLPISIIPKEKEPTYVSEIEDDRLSKFNNDENKGKHLILDMFLKSTQIYNSDENIDNSTQCSGETVYEEESNFRMENNVQTQFNGKSKTMSMSINLKSTKKIKRHHKLWSEKCIQTTLQKEMISKALQTTLKDGKSTCRRYTELPENFTLVFTNSEKSLFKFVEQKPETSKKFDFVYTPDCNCNCYSHGNKFFNFDSKRNETNFDLPKKCNTMSNYRMKYKLPRRKNNDFDKNKRNFQLLPDNQWNVKKRNKLNQNQRLYEQSPYFGLKENKCDYQNIYQKNGYDHGLPINFYKNKNNVIADPNLNKNIVFPSNKNYFLKKKEEKVNKNLNLTIESFRKFNPFHKSTQQTQKQNQTTITSQHNNENSNYFTFNKLSPSRDKNLNYVTKESQTINDITKNKINANNKVADNFQNSNYFTFGQSSPSKDTNINYVHKDDTNNNINNIVTYQKQYDVSNIQNTNYFGFGKSSPCKDTNLNYVFEKSQKIDNIIKNNINTNTVTSKKNNDIVNVKNAMYFNVGKISPSKHINPNYVLEHSRKNDDVTKNKINTDKQFEIQNLFEKELGEENTQLMKEFLEWNSQFSQDASEKPTDEWNWTRRDHFGTRYFINKKTGYASCNIPKPNQVFELGERPDFLPKGMSPIIKKIKDVDQSLSQNGKNTLFQYILETYKDDLLFVKWQHYLKDCDSKNFFENMYKEKLKMYEASVPNIRSSYKNQDIINLNRSLFENLEIIGQLDQKFIVVRDIKNNMLLLFDQHAIHERIRVEKLLKIYKSAKSSCKEKLIFFIPPNELSLLNRHESYLNYVGMTVEFFSNGVYVSEVPFCLYYKFSEKDRTKSLNEIIYILINEIIDLLKSTRGVSLKILPKLVQNVINLEACRGAIKFGDYLNRKQCLDLLDQLSKTDLPFQCAHGRPTVTPLLKLSLENVNNHVNKVNFKKIQKQVESTIKVVTQHK